MPVYSRNSKEKLDTIHPDLKTVFNEVIKIFDNTIIYGYRSPTIQFGLYKQGRKEVNGKWIIEDKSKVVTYCDGFDKKSNHNEFPSLAIDAIPYPVDWNDRERICYFAGFVMAIAKKLKEERKISHDIRWGGDWNGNFQIKDESLSDLAHFEIIK